VRKVVVDTAENVMAEKKRRAQFQGRHHDRDPEAAVTADQIATEAEFFSFGTNDLTQMTYGFSRDDAGKSSIRIIRKRCSTSIRSRTSTDGRRQAHAARRQARPPDPPEIKLGICGETRRRSSSVMFCHRIGLDYVSCSPFRVPIARLAAAHAAIQEKMDKGKKK
jgi:pyruvate,orthophosphate dikinase